MLQSMGLERVGDNLVTEQQQQPWQTFPDKTHGLQQTKADTFSLFSLSLPVPHTLMKGYILDLENFIVVNDSIFGESDLISLFSGEKTKTRMADLPKVIYHHSQISIQNQSS